MSMQITVFITLLFAAYQIAAENTFREVTIYDGHVTIEVPADWEAIPDKLLESHSMVLAETTGGLLTETYQFGFRTSDPEEKFVLPECMIQIRESGRLSYRQFMRLPTTDVLDKAGSRAVDERSGPSVRGLELEQASFDPDTFSLHLTNTLVLSYPGRTSVRSVSFLTERGFFTMHFYSRINDTETMYEISDRIIDSVRFDGELRYQPRLADAWPPAPSVILVLVGVFLAFGVLVVHLVQRRRKQP
jgi:hypothetical protein